MSEMRARARLAARGLVLFLGAGLVAQAPTSRPSERDPNELYLGVYTSDKATTMYVMFRPISEVLERSLEERLERKVRVTLRIVDGYQKAIDELIAGEIDFARFGPASYILARREQPKLELIAMELVKGRDRFSGVIAVREDSPFETLSDLRGATFAFGDPNSTIGRFLAEAELYRAGLRLTDIKRFDFLDRHDRVAKAVELGDFDAGALKINTFKAANSESAKLRMLHRFDNVTKPWIARAGMDPEVVAALRDALLSCEDEKALAKLGVSGFATADDDDYDFVRRGMRDAALFEGLDPDAGEKRPDQTGAAPGKER